MMSFLKKVTVFSVLLFSTACQTLVWEKPNGSQAEFEQVKANCMIEGFNNVPKDEETQIIGGYSNASNFSCKGHNCSSYSTTTTPQAVTIDHNAALRDQVYKACMARSGWLLVPKKED